MHFILQHATLSNPQRNSRVFLFTVPGRSVLMSVLPLRKKTVYRGKGLLWLTVPERGMAHCGREGAWGGPGSQEAGRVTAP